MFRYLLKYVGTYRVNTAAVNPNTGEVYDFEDSDDLYIPVNKKISIRHTYEEGKLCALFLDAIKTAHNRYDELKRKYPKIYLEFDEIGIDAYIYFMESDFDKVAKIIKPKASGKNNVPFKSLKRVSKVPKRAAGLEIECLDGKYIVPR